MSISYGPYAANIYSNDRKFQLVLDWSYKSVYFRNGHYTDPKFSWFVFTTDKEYSCENKFLLDENNSINLPDDILKDEFNKLKNIAFDKKLEILDYFENFNVSYDILDKII
jgi:hypothetical protein